MTAADNNRAAAGLGIPAMRAFRLLMHRVAIHAILLCDLLFVSRIYRVVDIAVVQPLLLGTLAAMACAYTLLAALERRYTEVVLQALYVALVATELLHFSDLASSSVNPNSVFQYVTVTNFVAFGAILAEGLGGYLLRWLVRYGLAYTVFYAAVAVLYKFNSVPREVVAALILDDPERGERLFNYAALTGFTWFFFVSEVRRRPRLAPLAGAALCGLAITLTLSRVYIACMVMVTGLWLVKFRLSTVRFVCVAVLWASSLSYFYGLVDPAWNPFTYFSEDTSGSVRAGEYETARYFIQRDPIWGAGIPSVQKDVEGLTGNYFFAAGDLGTFGTWFDLGVFGLALFLAGSHVVCHVAQPVEGRFRPALVLTGCMLTAYACVAPSILGPSGGTFFAIVLAHWFHRPRPLGPALPEDG